MKFLVEDCQQLALFTDTVSRLFQNKNIKIISYA